MSYEVEQRLDEGGSKKHLEYNSIIERKLVSASISQYYKAKDGRISSGGTVMIGSDDMVFRIISLGIGGRNLGQLK